MRQRLKLELIALIAAVTRSDFRTKSRGKPWKFYEQ